MKVLLFLLVVALAAVVCYAIFRITNTAIQKSRQRKMAAVAPHLLRYEKNLDPRVAVLLTQQHTALTTGHELVSRLLADEAILVPSEYVEPLSEWLTNVKEIEQ